MTVLRRIAISVVLYLSLVFRVYSEEYLSQTIRGVVGAGNYSYYRLTVVGDVILLLNSYEGDCDIYVSQVKLQPTFDPDEHCLQSATCGLDRIFIPAEFRRPVGIGIYGHPSKEISHYELQVILSSVPKEPNYFEDEYSDSSEYERNEPPRMPTVIKDDEESLLWSLFVGLLKILLEILT